MKPRSNEIFDAIWKETYSCTWIRGVVYTDPIQIKCYKNTHAHQVKDFAAKFPDLKLRFVVEC